jgi:hypothetical protein
MLRSANPGPFSAQWANNRTPSLWISLLAVTILLSGCGGSSSSSAPQSGTLSGNWQFSMTNPDPNYPANTLYGLQGGFLLQSNNSVSGQAVYLISGVSQTNNSWTICDSGSAQITGTLTAQTFNLSVAAGSQTFVLQGTLSNGQISSGTFSTPGGTVTGFTSCGMPASGQAWSAASVPSLTGSITGTFHSGGVAAPQAEANQDFPVTGFLTQGKNIGASNSTVTGALSFINPATGVSDYPCIPGGAVSVNGEISGNSVILQLIGTNGANAGQIGVAPGLANLGGNGTAPVTLNSTANGYALESLGVGYVVDTGACGGNSADSGYVCLGINGTACRQPITLTPAIVSFPAQLLGSTSPTTQTITLTSNQPSSAAALSNLSLTWLTANSSNSDTGQTDFTNIPDFSEVDTCVPGGESLPPGQTGSPFSLSAGQSCTISISFAPQESCTWLPGLDGGVSPAQCPLPLTAQVIVNNVTATVDNNPAFAVPINGTGSSFIQPSVPEMDFGAEAFGEASLPQQVTFTNSGATPVQILPPATCPLVTTGGEQPLTHPLVYPPAPPSLEFPVVAAGLQVVGTLLQDVNQSTISYNCDLDPTTMLPNFQISSNTCSGALLTPQQACSLEITFVPQSPKTYFSTLDYFLQLNTVQCTDPLNDPPSSNNPCELDGGRVPVELKANMSSPLRMVPGAGLDFGNVSVGKSSVAQTITLLNDPTLTPPQTVNFIGKIAVSGNYSETDDCPFSLASGASCTISVTFKPSAAGHNPGMLTINYTASGLSGSQVVYLRGTGQ